MSETQNLLTEAGAANYLGLSRSQMKINGPNGLAAFVASHTVSRKA
jgi:hypothetical protein